MRVLILTSSYPRFDGDGSAPFIKSIAEHLAMAGNDVRVVAPFDIQVKHQESPLIKIHRFRYTVFDKWHILGHAKGMDSDVKLKLGSYLLIPFYVFFALTNLWRISNIQKSQIIYAHWILPNGLPAAILSKLRKIPFVISIHGSDAFIANRNVIFRTISKWIFTAAQDVTSCSPTLKEMAMKAGAPSSTILLPYGVDTKKFHPVKKISNKDATELIVSVGRLVYKKGFDVLIKAMEEVHLRYPNIKLLIAGDGPIKSELYSLAVNKGLDSIVSLPGTISWDNAPSLMADSTIFVLPSIQDHHGNVDGLPNVLLEAMSCGCAIIASNISGVPLVIENGVNGILVPPGNIEALSDAICKLISNPDLRKTLSREARGKVEQELKWEHIVYRINYILEGAIWKHH